MGNYQDTSVKYHVSELKGFAADVLRKAGLETNVAELVAETLVEADLMGHTTHGLQLLGNYVKELENDLMTKSGGPELVSDQGAAVTWDGNYLPGPWLVHKAIDLAFERVKSYPVVTIVIRRSHHIACLATYPERVTKNGMMMLLSCSDPVNKTVAPFGGLSPVYSPNPLAVGIPTKTAPIIFDISTSSTANGLVNRALIENQKLPYKWLLDNQGNPTDDPKEFVKDPPATILPLGGLDAGYKGFALGILIEAMTSALGGYGRAENPSRWGASVFLQIINPEAFGGLESFANEMQSFVDRCKSSVLAPGLSEVRLPGERAFKLREMQMKEGVQVHPSIIPSLIQLAEKYQVNFPAYI